MTLSIQSMLQSLVRPFGRVLRWQPGRQCRAAAALVCALAAGLPAWAQTVTFINPGRSNEAFWVSSTKAMEAAAAQLGMQLQTVYAEREPTRALEWAQKIAQMPAGQRPRYAVVVNENGAGPEMIRLLTGAGVRVLVAWSGILNEVDQAAAGAPRQRHPLWIGSLQPKVEEAGYLTARALIQRARAAGLRGPDGKLRMIALGGDNNSTPAIVLRVVGMRKAVEEAGDVVLEQLVNARYDRKVAEDMTDVLIDRYPQAKLIWSATDQMAFGAMRSYEKRGQVPGRDVLFAGVNTSSEALEAVRTGRLTALSGGHFILGAWALVMIHDHHKGRDFAQDEGLAIDASMFALFTAEAAETFRKRYGDDRYDSVDFRRQSKVVNPNLKRYDFSFAQLLR